MSTNAYCRWIAFARAKRLAVGAPQEVARAVKSFVDTEGQDSVLIFDAVTSEPVELDLRGSESAVLDRLPAGSSLGNAPDVETSVMNTPRSVGRPKLGVTAREVTLLPRHWEWLASQPGGTSVALRKLVEYAMRANRENDRVRQRREAAYRFMHAMAGNEPGFEDAARALFAGDPHRFSQAVADWPEDIREHAVGLATAAAVEHHQFEPAP